MLPQRVHIPSLRFQLAAWIYTKQISPFSFFLSFLLSLRPCRKQDRIWVNLLMTMSLVVRVVVAYREEKIRTKTSVIRPYTCKSISKDRCKQGHICRYLDTKVNLNYRTCTQRTQDPAEAPLFTYTAYVELFLKTPSFFHLF